jgi:type III restriction enzyme
MGSDGFEKPILNSPYAYPQRHWELDEQGQLRTAHSRTSREY